MSGELEHAPMDPDSILEGVVAIDSEFALESLHFSDDGETTASSATEGDRSTRITASSDDELDSGTEVASLPNPNTSSSEAGPKQGKAPEVGQSSSANEEDDQAERAASDPTAGDETTSSNDKFELGENSLVIERKLNSKSTAPAPAPECFVYIVGTVHVSQESCDEDQAVIRHVKPQVVFLELCSSRASLLMPQKLEVPIFEEMFIPQIPTFEEMVIPQIPTFEEMEWNVYWKMYWNMYWKKDMDPFGIMYSWFLARVASKLEVFPGSEFRVAYEEALTVGAKVVLGDRPVEITFKRSWARLNTWHKTKLIFGLLSQVLLLPIAKKLNKMVEDMKGTDMMTGIFQELSKEFPSLMDTLVHERDLYMTAALREVAESFNATSVVAVVGKGHLRGMHENWQNDISIQELLEIPEKKRPWFSSIMRWGTVAVAVGGLAIFFRSHNKRSRTLSLHH